MATANLLFPALASRAPTADELDAVRARRLFPTRVIQAIQVQIQNRLIAAVLEGETAAPLPIRLADALPRVQGLLARAIGLGVRQEHVEIPAAPSPAAGTAAGGVASDTPRL